MQLAAAPAQRDSPEPPDSRLEEELPVEVRAEIGVAVREAREIARKK